MRLRGLAWDHPRGYDPLVACAAIWRAQTGIEIIWDRRSLQAFESQPVADLAGRYDLIVIDHPHVGQVQREECLLPLNRPDRVPDLIRLAREAVGESFNAYRWRGEQWALPIDAAAQVQAWRPDRLTAPPRTWDDVLHHARAGRVLVPLRPPHSLLLFFSLAANLGRPCGTIGRDGLIEPEFGAEVFGRMRDLATHLDPICYGLDPIAVLERMAQPEPDAVCAPYVGSNVSYTHSGFRAARLAFADMPAAGEQGSVGSTLCGAGIAVSALCSDPESAVDFAFWIAGADIQCGPYAAAGGQPANAKAWRDPAVNTASGNFFRATWETQTGASVRPRHDGYMAFQQPAAERLNAGLRRGEPAATVIADLNAAFRDSLDT